MDKIIIYQVLPRLFGNRSRPCTPNGTIEENGCGKFNDFTPEVLQKIKKLGVTHVWYTACIRHATTTDYSSHGIPCQHPAVVKGKAGSGYAISDYYDVDPDLAIDVNHRMQEFESLIKRTHASGMKFILDFVPNHVARQYHSIAKPANVKDLGEDDDKSVHFSPNNNFYYFPNQQLVLPESLRNIKNEKGEVYSELPAKATGNDRFCPTPDCNDWYEAIKFNYGIDYCDNRSLHFDPPPNTWVKMTEILLYWASKGIDGFRCDMAEMVPAQFWAYATSRVKKAHPGFIFIGEVYDPSQYRNFIASGFDYLYDKVGMYDYLRGALTHYCNTQEITYRWESTSDIWGHMLYFLENHDEQRIGSDFFAGDCRKAVPALAIEILMNTNPVMIYAGQEFGERGMDSEGYSGRDGRTTIFDYWSPEALRNGYYNPKGLTKDQVDLYDNYTKICSLARTEKAVSQGSFFDLLYVNGHLNVRQYPFLRKKDDDLLLVVANFDDNAVSVDVNIPKAAIEYMNIATGKYKATDLLSNYSVEFEIQNDAPVHVDIPSYKAIALKLKHI
ncbi:Alpha amylase, catalytic domain protein [Tritrichomonas musculus]|uniref:Alpha amylase, catalytic domain protein n=1 Tax=Tritrichomonas musculus TaxID=1915356 RepID=A0ABR2ILJ7_9EUKA